MFSSTWLTRKNEGDEWTAQLLKDQLHRYIRNRENADRQGSDKVDYKGSVGNMWSTSQVTQFDSNTTTGALLSETKLPQNLTGRKKWMICIYCSGQHWSDGCKKFPTVTARKEKIKDTVLFVSDKVTNRKYCTVKKTCVYCKKKKSSPQKSVHQEVSIWKVLRSGTFCYWTFICYCCYITYLPVPWWTSNRTYLAVLGWTSTDANRHRWSTKCTKIKKSGHQIASRHRKPKDLHHQQASRKTPVANNRIRNTDSIQTPWNTTFHTMRYWHQRRQQQT